MKFLTSLVAMFLPCGHYCHGDEANGDNHQKAKLEIEKAGQWQRLDRGSKPVTDEQINAFFEYIKNFPIIDYFETDDNVAINKIRAAQNLYENVNDVTQKQKSLNC